MVARTVEVDEILVCPVADINVSPPIIIDVATGNTRSRPNIDLICERCRGNVDERPIALIVKQAV